MLQTLVRKSNGGEPDVRHYPPPHTDSLPTSNHASPAADCRIEALLLLRLALHVTGGKGAGPRACVCCPAEQAHDGTTERDYWQKLMPEAIERFDEEVRPSSTPCMIEKAWQAG